MLRVHSGLAYYVYRTKGWWETKDHAVYSDFFNSKRKCKPEGYHTVCVQYVAVSQYCLSAQQMSKGKQCKVSIKKDQGLDHTTKLEVSLVRQIR